MDKIFCACAPAPVGPYSQAIRAGGFLFVSGQIAMDLQGNFVGGDVAAQTDLACRNLAAVLDAVELTMENVVKTTCFLTDMADFAAFNEVYAQHFPHAPARSCVAAAGLPKGALVEIEAVAAL